MVTRRDIIGGIAGILAARQMPAMPIGARTVVHIRKNRGAPTARDYVHNGLISMWDGIENSGFGLHSDTATRWVDLVNPNAEYGFDIFDAKWDRDSLYCHANGVDGATDSAAKWKTQYYNQMALIATGVKTYEICFRKENEFAYCQIVDFNGNTRFDLSSDTVMKLANNRSSDRITTSGLSLSGYGTTISAVKTHDVPDSNQPDYVDVTYRNGLNVPIVGGSTYLGQYRSHIAARDSYYSTTKLFIGKIYSMRLYSRDLTAAEIASNYAIDKARFGLT